MPPRQLDQLGFYIDPLDPLLGQRLRWLRAQGVNYVGFDGMGHREPPELVQMRRCVEDADLDLVVIHGEPGMVAANGDDAALRQAHLGVLQRAEALGARVVVLHFRILHGSLPGGYRDENEFVDALGLAEYDRRMTDLLRFLAAEADARGLQLALENLPLQWQYARRITDLVAYLETLALPNVRMCLDSGHAHLSGEVIADAIRTGREWLLTTHLHDNFGVCGPDSKVLDTDRHLVPGFGTINWPEAIRALREIEFAEPIMFEGVRTIPHGTRPDFEPAAELTLANWEVFERLADQLDLPPAHR